VAPGLNPQIVEEAKRLEFPFIPGVVTPTEIEKALSLENKLLKFFPAGVSGGIKTIKAISAPYMQVGVRFMPTGGVTIDNMSEYLRSEAVFCLGGTWIAPQKAISNGQWELIRDNCHRATTEFQNLHRGASLRELNHNSA
jgi:2-dehydro-3-deoxyphosphogluconate aldolase/(4S)-4-hydroxy-2-oxoglutarate aldolase